MANKKTTNDKIADLLDEIAGLLEAQSANRFRIQAYRDAAETVRTAEKKLAKLAQDGGPEALEALPNIGEGIAGLIIEFVQTGRSDTLARLQSQAAPGDLFRQVPGIGRALAARIAGELDISTLEELEQAAHDGRLDEVAGFGPEKVRNVQVSLAGMLGPAAKRARKPGGGQSKPDGQPAVEALLAVDEEYRREGQSGRLRKIAPKRFNPKGKAWLPVLNTERGGWAFTALFSNTAQAHELDKTDDWVVLYFKRNGDEEQVTVVTETKGPLKGKRVVRGREEESEAYYRKLERNGGS